MLKTSLEIKDGYAYITAEGSVNSANAAEFGNALAAVPEDITGVTLDIANIEYISSAGLRVVLNLKKRCGKKPFHIMNAAVR